MLKLTRKLKEPSPSLPAIQPQLIQDIEDTSQPQLTKPQDQLQLSPKELAEEFTRILNANNPLAAQNVARYSYKEQMYKCLPNTEHTIVVFEMDGYMQYIEDSELNGEVTATQPEATPAATDKPAITTGEAGTSTEAPEGGEEQIPKSSIQVMSTKNQFNSSERATQTTNNPKRDRAANTEPPPQKLFSGAVYQWSIFDAYTEDIASKERIAKEKAKAAPQTNKAHTVSSSLSAPVNNTPKSIDTLPATTKILSRMSSLNTYADIFMDYAYFEDSGDAFRDNRGTLLPLWKFSSPGKGVTGIRWTSYSDLFVAGGGNYEGSATEGRLLAWSLKNPIVPERSWRTSSGVYSLDVSKEHPNLVAVGLFDGSLVVFDMSIKMSDAPSYSASIHVDPVWQVTWQPDDLDGNPNFISVSGDGRVMNWALIKGELVGTDIIYLRIGTPAIIGSTEELSTLTNADATPHTLDPPKKIDADDVYTATCSDFASNSVFLIGTDEGKILKCSKTYHSNYLARYDGHEMGVYAVKYNPFYPQVFITCSADWTVQIWDVDTPHSVLTFDLGSSVGDVVWSPYSSTIFAACTTEGKVFVYDVSFDKVSPLCDQTLTTKSKLTHLSFSPTDPILLCGDDRGGVTCMKLSPNLRKNRRPGEDEDQSRRIEEVISVCLGRGGEKVLA